MAGKKEKVAAKRGPATIQNRRASFDYEFVDTVEAGVVLAGSEVKSLYLGRANMTDAFCRILNNELWILSLDIEPYEFAAAYKVERRRDRKLLMHRREIETLKRKTLEKGLALIPFKIYFKGSKAKVAVALARGKRQFDKRESIKEKDQRREMARGESEG